LNEEVEHAIAVDVDELRTGMFETTQEWESVSSAR